MFEQQVPQPPEELYELRGGEGLRAHTYATLRSNDPRPYSIIRAVPRFRGGLLPDGTYLGIGIEGRNLACSIIWSKDRSTTGEVYTPAAPPRIAPAAFPSIPGAALVAVDAVAPSHFIGVWRAERDTLVVSFRTGRDLQGKEMVKEVQILGKSFIRWRFVAAFLGIHGEPTFSLMSEARPGEWLHFASYTL
jgi:hypothetical protein